MRMTQPCRPTTCDHLQCFDASLFLMMNEKKPKWECPVCQKSAEPEKLQIDGFFLNLVKSNRLPSDENDIVLHTDGSWDPLNNSKSEPPKSRPRVRSTEALTKVSVNAKRTIAQSPNITLEEISEVSNRNNKRPRLASTSDEIECIDID